MIGPTIKWKPNVYFSTVGWYKCSFPMENDRGSHHEGKQILSWT